MISVPVFDSQGKSLQAVELEDTVLGGKVRKSLMRQAVQMYENNQHVCTKGTLTRGMVAGSTKKMYRQKHTGNARMGPRSAPHRRGGGVNFAPQARDISYSMPKEARRNATRSALLARLKDGIVTVVDNISLDEPKTRIIASMLKALEISGRCLIVVEGENPNIYKSGRNIANVTVRRAGDLNAYDMLQPDRVVFTQAAFNRVLEALK